MVPQRPVVIAVLLLGMVAASTVALAQEPAESESAAPAKAAPTVPPIEQRPYKIRVFVTLDGATRIDARARDRLIDAWRVLARRVVGAAWDVQVAESDDAASAFVLDDLDASDARPLGRDVDKVWLIQGRLQGGDLILSGRELDVATGWLGSLHERKVSILADLPRTLLGLTEEMFAPFAEIGEPKGDLVPLKVQGAALAPGPAGETIAPVGSYFRPIRVFLKDDGTPIDVQRILFSYLRVDVRNGAATTSTLIRGVKDPLTKRIVRKNRLIALGIKPASSATRLRFVQLPDRAPGAGYTLTSRASVGGLPREIATTDREGRVSLPPGFAEGLVILRLVAGKAEPMVELPVMPGESPDELTIPFDPRPATITLETQLDALRDAIVDVVAVRSRLERRMKAREDGDDWKGVEEALVEFRALPPRDVFAKRLDAIQEDAQRQEAKTKSVVLTRTARAQFADTKGLIDRYLDDETFRAYEDAVLRSKDRDARTRTAKASPKLSPRPPVAATPESKPGTDASTPAPRSAPSQKARPAPPAPAVPF